MGKLSSAFFIPASVGWIQKKSMSRSAYNLSESLIMLTFFANECKVILACSICSSHFYPTPRTAGSRTEIMYHVSEKEHCSVLADAAATSSIVFPEQFSRLFSDLTI